MIMVRFLADNIEKVDANHDSNISPGIIRSTIRLSYLKEVEFIYSSKSTRIWHRNFMLLAIHSSKHFLADIIVSWSFPHLLDKAAAERTSQATNIGRRMQLWQISLWTSSKILPLFRGAVSIHLPLAISFIRDRTLPDIYQLKIVLKCSFHLFSYWSSEICC